MPRRAARRSAADSAAQTHIASAGAPAVLSADTRPPPPRRTDPSSPKDTGPRLEASTRDAVTPGNLGQHRCRPRARLLDLRRDDAVDTERRELGEPRRWHLEHPD